MKLVLLLFPLYLYGQGCSDLFESLSPDSPTARYLRLLHHVAFEKNLLGEFELVALSESQAPQNPLAGQEYDTKKYVYFSSFEDVLKEGVQWDHIRNKIGTLAHSKLESENREKKANTRAKPVLTPVVLRVLGDFGEARGIFQNWNSADGTLKVAYPTHRSWNVYDTDTGETLTREGLLGHHKIFETKTGDFLAIAGRTYQEARYSLVATNMRTGSNQTYIVNRMGKLNLVEKNRRPFLFLEQSEPLLLDLERGTKRDLATMPHDELQTHVSPSGEIYLSGVNDRHLYLYSVGDRTELLKKITLPRSPYRRGAEVFFDEEDLYLAEGKVVYDIARGRELPSLGGPVGFLKCRDGKVFYASLDGTRLVLVDVQSSSLIEMDIPTWSSGVWLRELSDGRKLGVLTTLGGSDVLVDFEARSVQRLRLPGLLRGITKKNDGNLYAIVARGGTLIHVQLYGPLPESQP